MKPIAKMTKAERAAVLKDPFAKLSDLLEIAARDALALKRQKRVKFNMGVYVMAPASGEKGSKCTVCLAGAALYRDASIRDGESVGDLPSEFQDNAFRIDSARTGVTMVRDSDASEVLSAVIRPHVGRDSRYAPFRVYLKAARKLREAGL